MLVSNIKGPVVSGSNQGSNNLTLKGWPLTVSLFVCLSFKSGLIFFFFPFFPLPDPIFGKYLSLCFECVTTNVFLFSVKYLLLLTTP